MVTVGTDHYGPKRSGVGRYARHGGHVRKAIKSGHYRGIREILVGAIMYRRVYPPVPERGDV
jgi:hypothetical protein